MRTLDRLVLALAVWALVAIMGIGLCRTLGWFPGPWNWPGVLVGTLATLGGRATLAWDRGLL